MRDFFAVKGFPPLPCSADGKKGKRFPGENNNRMWDSVGLGEVYWMLCGDVQR